MLVLLVTEAGVTRRFTSVLDKITIGRADTNDVLLLSREVGSWHARIVREGETWILSATGKTLHNNWVVDDPRPVTTGDRIAIGPYQIEVGFDDTSEEEQALVAALAGADEVARAVYADWLEQHGHADRAEFLRAQAAVSRITPAHPTFAAATARVREIAKGINPEWRMRVARPAVEDCKVAPEFTCGVDWAELAPTTDPKLRTCTKCQQLVRYCTSEAEAMVHAGLGACLVVDLAAPRTSASIESRARARPMMPGMYMPMAMLGPPTIPSSPASRICPSCHRLQPPGVAVCTLCGAGMG
jgi:uncharacterized protein (TIGR02996 family)